MAHKQAKLAVIKKQRLLLIDRLRDFAIFWFLGTKGYLFFFCYFCLSLCFSLLIQAIMLYLIFV